MLHFIFQNSIKHLLYHILTVYSIIKVKFVPGHGAKSVTDMSTKILVQATAHCVLKKFPTPKSMQLYDLYLQD